MSSPDDIPMFPCTPHLAGSWGTDDDLWATPEETAALLQCPVTVQEKLDGLNVGFWTDGKDLRAVSKTRPTKVIPFAGVPNLGSLASDISKTLAALGPRYALFGEYMPLALTNAPWYLIDIYDRCAKSFFAQANLEHTLRRLLRLPVVPTLFRGRIASVSRLRRLIEDSEARGLPMEGVYVRYDVGAYLKLRYKYVRRGFTKRAFPTFGEFC
jgi:hypothetical protein